MTLYELLQIKEDYIETSDVDYDVLVGTDLVKDEDINENTDNYYKFLNYIAHNVEVTDARNDICNWSKFVLDHKVALAKYAEENWYEVPEDESDFIYNWINELHGYQAGSISEKMYKEFIDAMNTYQKDERTYKPYYDYLKQYISDNLDNGLITLYHSYDDSIDKDIIQKYINAVVLGYPTDSFYDVIYEYASDCIDVDYYEDALINELLDNAPTEEIREQIKNADYADIIDDLNECGYIGVDYNIDDLLRNTSIRTNILLGTDTERNYDMGSIVTAYGNDYQYPFKDCAKPDADDYDNALTYLIHQQGHTVQDVLANHLDCCLSEEQISKSGFIKGVCTDIEENSSEAMSELGVYVELSGNEIAEFCDKLSDKNAYFVFDKEVNIGLFNEWSGTCGYPDNYLERDFVVPTTMVRNVQIEGVRPITRKRAEELRNIYKNTDSEYEKQRAGQNLETEGVIGYTIDGVCGMVGDFWKSNSVSYTDTAPTLVNENIETTLNEIEQTIEEKNKCEEIER